MEIIEWNFPFPLLGIRLGFLAFDIRRARCGLCGDRTELKKSLAQRPNPLSCRFCHTVVVGRSIHFYGIRMKKLLATGVVLGWLVFNSFAQAQSSFFGVENQLQGRPLAAGAGLGESVDAFGVPYSQPLFFDATTGPSGSPDVTINSPTSTRNAVDTAAHPEASSAAQGQFPGVGISYGLAEFANHFAPYQPMYFIGGTQSPNVKFQFSIRYRLFTPDGPLAKEHPWVKGFNIAYTQTSLWDLNAPSAPFFDTSYMPEFFYYLENIRLGFMPPSSQLGLQIGAGHESNGKDGTQSRTVNEVYIRPVADIPLGSKGWFLTVAPKIYEYVGNLSDNPDIARFRGHADVRIVFGQRDGIQLASIGRIGDHFDRWSEQFDLTYPLTKILHGNADVSLDAQYFTGYGESLLRYNQRSSIFRMGLAIVR